MATAGLALARSFRTAWPPPTPRRLAPAAPSPPPPRLRRPVPGGARSRGIWPGAGGEDQVRCTRSARRRARSFRYHPEISHRTTIQDHGKLGGRRRYLSAGKANVRTADRGRSPATGRKPLAGMDVLAAQKRPLVSWGEPHHPRRLPAEEETFRH